MVHSSTVEDIVKQACELTRSERAEVVVCLLKTLDLPGNDVADEELSWRLQLDRRAQELENGALELVDWDELRARLLR